MDHPFASIHRQFLSQVNAPVPNVPIPQGYGIPVQGQRTGHSAPAGDDKEDKKDKAKRLGQACGACRKRKVKCSGDKPVCTNCLRLNSPCVYAPSIKGKAPRSGYNEILQKRLDKMEKLLQPIKQDGFGEEIWKSLTDAPDDEKDLLSDGESRPSPHDSPIARGVKRTADGERKASWHNIQKTGRKAESPPASMPLEGRVDEPSTMEDEEDEFRPTMYNLTCFVSNYSPLPPLHIQEHLAETYFANCHVPYIVLHKPTFMKQIAAGTVAPALILAVCAVSARFSRHPEVKQQPMSTAGDEYAAKARQLLSLEFDRPTLSNVQAFVILGLHEFGSSRGARAWMYAGTAIRMAISLGLNVEDETRLATQSWLECEIRRRVFWATFIMDRFSSSSSAQAPHFLREKDVLIQLPCSDYEFINKIPAATEMLNGGYNPSILKVPGVQLGALDPCAYFIRMISTWGRVVSYVNGPRNQTLPPWDPNSDFAKFDNELYSMHSSLPQHYIYTRNNLSAAIAENRAHSLIFLHVTIRHSLYFLHRWLFPSKANAQMTSMYKDAPPDFINTSARKCIAAANAISMILADVQEMNTLLLVPFMGFCAFTTATLHVSNAFSPDPEISSTAKRHLATNLKILMVMRKHWTVTDRWCQAVRELYELQQNSATDRRGNFTQNAIANAITYGSFKDDIPNKFDKQQFLYQPSSNTSNGSGSPLNTRPSLSPGLFADVLQTPQPPTPAPFTVDEKPPKLQLQPLYPPPPPADARRKAEEERAVLEAMTQSASLPVSPYLGHTGFLNFVNDPHVFENEIFGQYGINGVQNVDVGVQGTGVEQADVTGMEDFPSLDEILSSMQEGGLEAGGFGFLDDLNLFDGPL